MPHYVPSRVVNTFAAGSRQPAAIGDRAHRWPACPPETPRELGGVLAHEIVPYSEFEQALKDGRLAVVVPEEIVRWMQAQPG